MSLCAMDPKSLLLMLMSIKLVTPLRAMELHALLFTDNTIIHYWTLCRTFTYVFTVLEFMYKTVCRSRYNIDNLCFVPKKIEFLNHTLFLFFTNRQEITNIIFRQRKISLLDKCIESTSLLHSKVVSVQTWNTYKQHHHYITNVYEHQINILLDYKNYKSTNAYKQHYHIIENA